MVSNSDTLRGRTVMVTGCNRGIGLETVKLFAARGANLICCVRSITAEFQSTIDALSTDYGVNIECICFNLSDEASITAALKPLVHQRRHIDVLVNNAGISAGGTLQMTTIESIKCVFQINFFSQVLITQMISKLMMRHKYGAIVNLGSVAGLDNFRGYTAYGSSKAALMFFTKTVARELAPYNIRVNAVAPGLIKTAMAREMDDKAATEMISRSDMQRLGHPEEVAKTIVWLASDDASFITGQIIRVDGGM